MRPLAMARFLISRHVRQGDRVIDGTLGNGYDTVLLAKLVGFQGSVLGFDVQPEAIASTRSRLEASGLAGDYIDLRCEGHETLAEMDLPALDAAMFNFGYLPGSDKKVITRSNTTLIAVDAVMQSLRCGGLLTLMCYPGHEGGDLEAQALLTKVSGIDRQVWSVLRVDELDPSASKPFLLALWKRI